MGPSEEAAREAGHDVVVAKHQFRANSRAQILGELDGLVKIIAKGSSAPWFSCGRTESASGGQSVPAAPTVNVGIDCSAAGSAAPRLSTVARQRVAAPCRAAVARPGPTAYRLRRPRGMRYRAALVFFVAFSVIKLSLSTPHSFRCLPAKTAFC